MTYDPQGELLGSDGDMIVHGIIRDLRYGAHGLGVDAERGLRYSIHKEPGVNLCESYSIAESWWRYRIEEFDDDRARIDSQLSGNSEGFA